MWLYERAPTPKAFISVLTLRRALGVLGVLLPVLCLVVGAFTELKSSISAYYDSPMRDVFVGILFVMGWFLFAYKGHEAKDDIAGDIAWLAAMGVALLPATNPNPWISGLHFVSAGVLFLTLAVFSLCLFTKTNPENNMTAEKIVRNRIYRACGGVMLGCIVAIGLHKFAFDSKPLNNLHPVFWLEAFAMWAFGVSWFVKGETICKDCEKERPNSK